MYIKYLIIISMLFLSVVALFGSMTYEEYDACLRSCYRAFDSCREKSGMAGRKYQDCIDTWDDCKQACIDEKFNTK